MADDTQKLTEDLVERIHAGVVGGLTPRDAAKAEGVPFDVHMGWLIDGLADVEDKKDTLQARYARGLQERAKERRSALRTALANARAVGDLG